MVFTKAIGGETWPCCNSTPSMCRDDLLFLSCLKHVLSQWQNSHFTLLLTKVHVFIALINSLQYIQGLCLGAKICTCLYIFIINYRMKKKQTSLNKYGTVSQTVGLYVSVTYILFSLIFIRIRVLSIKSKFKQTVSQADIVNRWLSHSMTEAEWVRSVKFPSANLLLQSSMVFMANIPRFGLIIYLRFTLWYFKGFSGTCWFLTLNNKCCTKHC